MDHRKKLERFVRRHLFNVVGEFQCTNFVLKHTTAGKGANQVVSLERPSPIEDDTILELVDELLTMADSDAVGVGGLQSYVVQAYYTDDKAHGRCTMRIEGSASDEDEFTSEPASQSGLLAQLMRHNESLNRSLVGSQHQVLFTQTKMIEKLADQNAIFMNKQIETTMVVEELLSQRHEREEQSRLSEAKIEGVTKLAKNLDLLAPVIAQKLSGRKGRKALPAGDPMKAIISKLAGSIEPEQMAKLKGVLEPGQLAILFELMKAAGPNGGGATKH